MLKVFPLLIPMVIFKAVYAQTDGAPVLTAVLAITDRYASGSIAAAEWREKRPFNPGP